MNEQPFIGTEKPLQFTARHPVYLDSLLGRGNYRRLSRLSGISRPHLTNILKGRVQASNQMLVRIALAATVGVEELQNYIEYQRLNAPITIHSSNGASSNNPLRKLTDVDAAMIRARYANRNETNVTMRSLAKEYGVSAQTISNVVHELSHVTIIRLTEAESNTETVTENVKA